MVDAPTVTRSVHRFQRLDERRQPQRPRRGEPWTYAINGVTTQVTVTVVVPARNEAANLAPLFAGLPPVYELILVDGSSVDGTIDEALRLDPEVRIVRQRSRGKGGALIEGLDASTGDITVFIDADGSNDPAEVERFVLALVNGADIAKGSRFLQCGGSSDITPIRRAGNAVIRATVNRACGTSFTDLAYGFNALWTRLRDDLSLDCEGFEIETLLHVRAARLGLTIQEVPSFEGQRSTGHSNLHAVRDGVRIAALLVREATDHYLNPRPDLRTAR